MNDHERKTTTDSLLQDLVGEPREEQLAHLYRTSTDDGQMMAEMMALLDPVTRADTIMSGPGHFMIGRVVDKYRLVRLLGEGGMGAVFLAERVGDFSMPVAIKLIRSTTPELLERFARERQILASLRHPGIAVIYDGGADEVGTPYLAMEYVDGMPITRYAAAKQLNIAERLALFTKVCDAVVYAHQNLVIHRDIKPSNVFVSEAGEPKLLDFGLATLQTPGAETLLTLSTGMTPAYASPEQIEVRRLTAATDQYSLGVVLFELLTGRHPFLSQAPGSKPIDRSMPIRPSDLVLQASTQVSDPLPLPDKQLSAHLTGDLDAIVLKALRAEPEARYGSVGELAADIRRYLAGEPVQARPPSRAYLLRKFVVRHRIETSALAVVIFGLVVAGGWSVHAWSKERAALHVAQTAQEETAAVNDFVFDLLTSPSPDEAGKDVRVVEVLDQAAAAAPSKFKGRPLVLAGVLDELGSSFCNLEQPEKGLPLLRRSLLLYRTAPGAEPDKPYGVEFDEIVCSANERTEVQSVQRWQDYYARVKANPPDQDGHRLGIALGELGHAYIVAITAGHREYAQAAREALTTAKQFFTETKGPDDGNTMAVVTNLATLEQRLGNDAVARPMFEENLVRLSRVEGPNSLPVQITLMHMAAIDAHQGQYEAALQETRRSIDIGEHLQGADAVGLLPNRLLEARVLVSLGRRDAARAVLQNVLRVAGDRPTAAEAKAKAQAELAKLDAR